jgi:hypothetical protein
VTDPRCVEKEERRSLSSQDYRLYLASRTNLSFLHENKTNALFFFVLLFTISFFYSPSIVRGFPQMIARHPPVLGRPPRHITPAQHCCRQASPPYKTIKYNTRRWDSAVDVSRRADSIHPSFTVIRLQFFSRPRTFLAIPASSPSA